MKTIEITSFGALDVLQPGERPRPVPGIGELLIRVSASGINRPDVLQRTGNYPVPPGASDVPGLKVAGVIEQSDARELAQAGFRLGEGVCAQAIVTAGSDEKCAACLALGANHAINYKTHDFQDEVERLTGGRGVNVILDMVAGSYVAKEIECLSEDGRLVIIAVQGGIKSEINAGLVLRRRLTVTGSTLRPRSIAFKEAIA